MKKLLVFSVLFLAIIISCKREVVTVNVSEEIEKKEILAIMKTQEEAWSNHDLEGFMQGYWKSDSLKFYGSNGITFGWDKTLANYKKGYPTKDYSGELKFKVNDISKINNDAYFVMGAYHLTRKVGNANGVFMIIFKKINGEWKIIADTSC
ncbi:nuclear transport factor 2 family protein [Tenacibaculum sp. AHE15PA]|uniref:YybH family protein n=1 Tax=unclassified Tenacibaculum TaxID=2635139 RepID=UPI001C5011A9|nr:MULTISPECIES: nuclear transport factor 2 family protein [unclassified Tenacibaculum]QXP74004.1 nuclear transport factor 2 family protein [Tenacibaculum sp. AHE14PA]QXP75628.1 nuclear transport factor 2 family protein [Tenacibaculum sp. AHE15PA]